MLNYLHSDEMHRISNIMKNSTKLKGLNLGNNEGISLEDLSKIKKYKSHFKGLKPDPNSQVPTKGEFYINVRVGW